MDDASLTSASERSAPPVTLMMTPRAPFTDAPSSSGLEIARRAASLARSWPSPTPVPIIASPIPAMIVFTSAKSRLIRPGTRIRSEMPWIACLNTSSAVANASVIGVVRSMMVSSRSLGIVMMVSTQSRRDSSPRSAWRCRLLPSNLNGLVTTAIVSAPSSPARLAITGAAPVPVPPPSPVVTKTMSAPSSAWMIFSVSSSAACRPTLGSAPAPRPLVSLLPICSLMGAAFPLSAWRSVLATMNWTPSRPTWTMRLTALLPPRSAHKGARADRCARRIAQGIAIAVQRQPAAGGERRAVDVIRQAAHASRTSPANREIENLFRDLGHTVEDGAAARQHDAGIEALLVAGAPDLVPHKMEDLLGARLKNFSEDSTSHHAGFAAADARHFHRLVFVDHARQGTSALALDFFRAGHRR